MLHELREVKVGICFFDDFMNEDCVQISLPGFEEKKIEQITIEDFINQKNLEEVKRIEEPVRVEGACVSSLENEKDVCSPSFVYEEEKTRLLLRLDQFLLKREKEMEQESVEDREESVFPSVDEKEALYLPQFVCEGEKTKLSIRLYQFLLKMKKDLIQERWDSSENDFNYELFYMIDRVFTTYDVNVKNPYTGMSMIEYAIKYNANDLFLELLLAGAEPRGLAFCISRRNIEYIKLLLSYGAERNYALSELDTRDAKQKMIKDMLTGAIDIETRRFDVPNEGYMRKKMISADLREVLEELELSCKGFNHGDLIHDVLLSGDVNFQDCEGETLLMQFAYLDFDVLFGAKSKSINVMKLLLKNGADIHTRDVEGLNALVHCNSVSKQQLLIEAGIDYTEEDLEGIYWFVDELNDEDQEKMNKLILAKRFS